MSETWEIERGWLRWWVIRVSSCGVVAGVPTRPFRTVERAFWRHGAAMGYAVSRPATAHVRVANAGRL